MSKNVIIGIGIVGVLIVAIVAAYVLRPPAEASAPIEAIPVEVEQEQQPDAEEAMPTEEPTEEPTAEVMAEKEEMSEPEQSTEEIAEEAALPASEEVVIFSIVQAESEVRFTLGELLNGAPKTVIGTTDQVAGEVAIDPAAPADSKVGVILINARTFVTDSDFRNRAINNEILETDEFEFVNFTPTAIMGFPENPEIGQALEFQITGDLTIRDITNEVTFDVTVTVVSETRLEGSASATISRADYDLVIPEVPRVADVDEEVLLEIDFVAVTE
jgi:polyisoprenoid-binding protein YceI